MLAIPDTPPNDELAQFAAARDLRCFRGSEWDVLDRYLGAAEASDADVVVRITGDCPLVDPEIVDQVVTLLIDRSCDYVRTGVSFPDGFDVEAATLATLARAASEATDQFDREHVTPFLRNKSLFRWERIETDKPVPDGPRHP